MNPRYPIYIPTKGRFESRRTIRMFEALALPFTIFVEEQEYDAYAQYVDESRIVKLPHRDKGVTVTRNFIWDYAAERGNKYYWTFDDNINGIYRFNYNLKTPCGDGTILRVIEDFAKRYTNLSICGMNYFMFVTRKSESIPPYYLNTRIYSNMLIKTFAKDSKRDYYRFNTFYNEDTDICLRYLKDGWCSVLFNSFLIDKAVTMSMSGGNSEYYTKTNKRREFVEELIRAHPDKVRLTEKWGRFHHQVDYSKFKQQLRRKEGIEIPEGVNNFGMVLQEKLDGEWVDL